jgi:hypothetical protein
MQVIRRDDAIVCPHLWSKIQESFKDRGWNYLSTRPRGPRQSSARTQTSFLVGYSHHDVICLCFWLLWRDNFAKHLSTNRSHEPDMPTKVSCLLLPSRALFDLSTRPIGEGNFCWLGVHGLNIQGLNILFCVECTIFKIRIICGLVKIFKVWIFYFASNAQFSRFE